MSKYSYRNIVPEQIQNLLIQDYGSLGEFQWVIGDTLLQLLEVHRKAGNSYRAEDIAKAMASFTGFRSKQILTMAAVSKRFPPEKRSQYSVLSYGHFAQAARFANADEALDWCIKEIDELGRPATVDALTVVFRNAGTLIPKVDEDTPEAVQIARKNAKRRALRTLRDLIFDINNGKIDANSKVKDHLVAAMAFLQPDKETS